MKESDLLVLKALVNNANTCFSIGWPVKYLRDGLYPWPFDQEEEPEPPEDLFQRLVDIYVHDNRLERWNYFKFKGLEVAFPSEEFNKRPEVHCLVYMLLRDQYDCWGKWKHEGGPITRAFLKKLRGAEQKQGRRFKHTKYEEFINSLKEHKWPKRHLDGFLYVGNYEVEELEKALEDE